MVDVPAAAKPCAGGHEASSRDGTEPIRVRFAMRVRAPPGRHRGTPQRWGCRPASRDFTLALKTWVDCRQSYSIKSTNLVSLLRPWTGGSPPAPAENPTRTPTPASQAKLDAVADLRQEWQETARQVLLSDEDLEVRRCILPGLDLRAEHAPERLKADVAEATRVARNHPDEYLRHRVEHQV